GKQSKETHQMNRKIKTLGVVLASVFAMSAIGASAASAAEFHSAIHPQSIHGTQTGSHVFTTNAGTVTCKKATFTGTTAAKTSKTQTLAPDYNECTAFGFINVPIHENGCAYIFYSEPAETTEVECPSGKKIEITAPFCTTTVGPQHIEKGMTYTNKEKEVEGKKVKEHIIAHTSIQTEIDYNECGTARTNGTYTGTTTVVGAEGPIWYE
ncbi:MAG TPA: hypothetical protein VHR38_07790, partial [Solirubrobacterales bacterium]|nr:hypothetical protein [Solirubrobacterales bacterium]